MAAPMNVSLPPFFELSDGMQIVVTALDATTGNLVSGVVVSGVSVDVIPSTASQPTPVDDFAPSPLLVPTG
jgi:hypothetical protein